MAEPQASCDGRPGSRGVDIAISKSVANHHAENTAQPGHRQSRENSWMSRRACAPWHYCLVGTGVSPYTHHFDETQLAQSVRKGSRYRSE
jgi:hypothetical protein